MKELQILDTFIYNKGIRHSKPREQILRVFLETERHLSVQELFGLVQKKHPTIGIATIYRTMALACEAGLAREIDFGEGNVRYEHLYGHEHHDHLVCIQCGAFREITNSRIEKEQMRMANEHGFDLVRHRHVLYGVCPECRKV